MHIHEDHRRSMLTKPKASEANRELHCRSAVASASCGGS